MKNRLTGVVANCVIKWDYRSGREIEADFKILEVFNAPKVGDSELFSKVCENIFVEMTEQEYEIIKEQFDEIQINRGELEQ